MELNLSSLQKFVNKIKGFGLIKVNALFLEIGR